MSRLGVLYALKDDELNKLCSLPQAERYNYMLEEIEESLLDTPRGCELDKSHGWYPVLSWWWSVEGGKFYPDKHRFRWRILVETEDEIITLKKHSDVIQIVDYLHQNDLKEIKRKIFT